jgi:hypothetical protein
MDGLRALLLAEAEEGRVGLAYLADLLGEGRGDVPGSVLARALVALRKVNGLVGEVVGEVEPEVLGAPIPAPTRR